MTRNTAGPVVKRIKCEFCGGDLVGSKPRYMIADENGMIRGYFHSGCAEKLVLAQKTRGVQAELPGLQVGEVIPKPREETLPW